MARGPDERSIRSERRSDADPIEAKTTASARAGPPGRRVGARGTHGAATRSARATGLRRRPVPPLPPYPPPPLSIPDLAPAVRLLAGARRILVLTGAGVSHESGVPTFRGAGGLWRSHRAEDLATPQAFARDPRLVWEWYGVRRETVAGCAP